MNLNKKLFISALLIFPIFTGNTYAKEFDKKEIKEIKKTMGVGSGKAKKTFSDDRVAILSNVLKFRTEAKRSEESSNKSAKWTKAAAIAQLKGVPDSTFQEITEEFNKELIKRFKAIGVELVTVSEMEKAKSFSSLVGDVKPSTGEVGVDSKKNWGVSKNTNPIGHYAVWYNYFKPFGAHAKVPKELKAAVFNSFILVDFARIGVEVGVSQGVSSSMTSTTTTTSVARSYAIEPVVNIGDGTITIAGVGKELLPMLTTEKGSLALNLQSDIDYAKSSEVCPSCTLGFESKSFINEGKVETIAIEADPELYKKAALDALNQYLDTIFAVYSDR